MSRLLILDKENATSSTNDKYTYRYKEEIQNVKNISLKKCILTAPSKYKLLYIRSNLAQHIKRKTIAGTSGGNRNSNIIGVLSTDLSTATKDGNITSTTSSNNSVVVGDIIKLDGDNDFTYHKGKKIYRISDAGGIGTPLNSGTGSEREVIFESSNGLGWNIKVISYDVNSADTIYCDEVVSGTESYTVFSISGSGTNEEFTSDHSKIRFEFDPSISSVGFDIVLWEKGDNAALNHNAGTDEYTRTDSSVSNLSNIVQYYEIGNSLFSFTGNNDSIRDISFEFYDSILATTPISDIDHFCMVFNI